MNAPRESRRAHERHTSRWRTYVLVGSTVVLIAMGVLGVALAPQAGHELENGAAVPSSVERTDVPASLDLAEAATTIVGVAPPLPGATAAAGPPSTSTPEELAGSDLEGFFVALDAGDLVGAFDHLSAQRQTEVGGYRTFEALWKATGHVSVTRPACLAHGDLFTCTVLLTIVDASGTSCAASVDEYDVRRIGTRHRIVAERSQGGRPCAVPATATSPPSN